MSDRYPCCKHCVRNQNNDCVWLLANGGTMHSRPCGVKACDQPG